MKKEERKASGRAVAALHREALSLPPRGGMCPTKGTMPGPGDRMQERGERREERDGKKEVTHSNIDITPLLTTHCTCSM